MSTGDWPKVGVLFATFKRTAASLQTIESLRQYLVYPNLTWHVCDDGSGETDDGTHRNHAQVCRDAIAQFDPTVTMHEMDTRPGEFNTGGNLNRGLDAVYAKGCDIYYLCFDDWALFRELDIRPMVDVLDNEPQVGFIRLSYHVPGHGMLSVRYDSPRLQRGYMWLRIIRDWSINNPFSQRDNYLVSTQPYVAHRRFHAAYGMHPERVNPGLAEVGLGAQYNNSPLGEGGPQILYPIGEITVHAPFAHLVPRAHDYLKVCGPA
jgi:hypothetical protein